MSSPRDPIPRGTVVFPAIVQVHFDGACEPARGGGVAGYGFVVEGLNGDYEEKGLAAPPWSARATNNVAEYVGAIRALEWLSSRGFRGQVILFGDSQLVIRQMQGEYAVRAEHLRAYWDQLRGLCERFSDVRFVWVRRAENSRADALSKAAIIDEAPSAIRRKPTFVPAPVDESELDGTGGPSS